MNHQDNPYGLTNKQLEVCNKALDSGFEDVTKGDAKVLALQASTNYLDAQRESLEKGHPLTYIKKLNHCNSIIDACGSESIIQQIKSPESFEERDSALRAVKICLEAIKVTNEMQGHYAPTKSLTVSATFDSSDLRNAIDELRVRHAPDTL